MTTVGQLIAELEALPSGTVVAVWDPLLDAPCHVQRPLTDAAAGSVVLIESNAQRITEEDAS